MISATASGKSSLPAATDDKSERMLVSNIDLVRRIAGRIHQRVPPCVELDDLFQAGIVGLIDAIRKFDERRHVQFEHYAQFRINGAIIDSLRELDWSPRALRRKAQAMARARDKLSTLLGRAPDDSELAAEIGLELHQFNKLIADLRGLELCSFDFEEVTQEGKENCQDYADPRAVNSYAHCLQFEMNTLLGSALSDLSIQQQNILTLYYRDQLTMAKIGKSLGVSESRISQLHSAAILHLRSRIEELLSAGASASTKNAETLENGEEQPACQ
ncbi:MAG TPA: FliA/WhiG family RNA polymerase sigma factor [Terriglobales bacterium]|nr:FliA/WhiG family RNA polymerase sigma factor [Terriglobales bacterium]